MHYRNVMALYNNNDAWMCKMFLSTLEGPTMRWFSEVPLTFSSSIYLLYHDVRKRHKALFKMTPQSNDESLMTYLKRFSAELAKVEKLDDMLAIMLFKQGLYHSPLSRN
ncbi:hypothetical protein D8674_019291 [Pyrus ussuriensis x Pyrus communis]|uniref:Retrotransposon gag domain-containing protein n=1 Tax=Pyrus ussuriensis x Pyrus communis TaxID=2448454 RepID=A0A5N5G772_9ROSA|nr:hypothetical protein D8674_019291 [Pyrus ussuriensis x Pyrus communis]